MIFSTQALREEVPRKPRKPLFPELVSNRLPRLQNGSYRPRNGEASYRRQRLDSLAWAFWNEAILLFALLGFWLMVGLVSLAGMVAMVAIRVTVLAGPVRKAFAIIRVEGSMAGREDHHIRIASLGLLETSFCFAQGDERFEVRLSVLPFGDAAA